MDAHLKSRDFMLGERHSRAEHEIARLEVRIHLRQRIFTGNALGRDLRALLLGQMRLTHESQPEPQSGEVGFVVLVRKTVVWGKRWVVVVGLGGRRPIKK